MNPIVVQKFGGTSVASESMRTQVISHVIRAIDEGYSPVVVVSAMGRRGDPYATDSLLELVKADAGDPGTGDREIDLLLSCGEVISTVVLAQMLKKAGHRARSFTGAQAGIVTDDQHGEARILRIDTKWLIEAVDEGFIPVVAGFQGACAKGEITTLGRGGSDTTAAALAVALGAEFLEVYSDVDGVKTADPRIAPHARTLARITYNEAAEMAHLGAKVLHPRAVEIAMNGNLPIKVRPTATNGAGTLVSDAAAWGDLEGPSWDRPVTGIAHVTDRLLVHVTTPPEDDMAAVSIFHALGNAGISVDMIRVQPASISFIAEGKARPGIEEILTVTNWPMEIRSDLAKVSAVGAGMHEMPGVMARVAKALQRAEVPIFQTSDSHANISCLVPAGRVQEAVLALHDEFNLGSKTRVEAKNGSPDADLARVD